MSQREDDEFQMPVVYTPRLTPDILTAATGTVLHFGVWLETILDDLSPQLRVATAVIPFAVAMVVRLVAGKNRYTRLAVSFGTMWFAINVLMAPYSERMRQDILNLPRMLR